MCASHKKSGRLFLMDGTAMAYRAYFAFIRNPLINSKGINTGGVFGFANGLLKILRDEKPEYLACIFDMAAPTFRHKAYREYKATREKMPDELADQLPMIRELVKAFRIPILEKEGFEADDIMATLALRASKKGFDTYLVTGDKDMMQLVGPRVQMYITGRGRDEADIMGPEGVKQKMGVTPEQIVDLLGLMGDSSDNVPGVPGVGPKTACDLIQRFGSMESIYNTIDQIKRAKLREKLIENKKQAFLSKELVTLHTNVPLSVTIEDMKVKDIDQEKTVALFRELEFNRLLQDIAVPAEPKTVRNRIYRTIESDQDRKQLFSDLKKTGMFAVDLETTSLDPISADIVGFSFSWKEGEACYLPLICPKPGCQNDLFSEESDHQVFAVPDELKNILENDKLRKCGQNIKYDWLVLRHHGINLKGVDFDSMVAAYLVNPSSRQYNIDALALEHLHFQKIPTRELIGTGKNQISMADVPLEKISEYACEDADAAFQLRKVLEPKLKNTKTIDLFREVEIPLIHVLVEMEENGVALDTDLLFSMSKDMDRQLNVIQEEIYKLAGETFNINSTQQLGHILFEKLKVHEELGGRKPRRTKTGYATDVRVLESLSAHPLPEKLLDYRQLMKLKSTYVDALPKLINPETGRVHASFNQAVAATGRLSSSNPNLQNIPIRTDLGREIRRAFKAGQKGWKIFSADYSQIELRIMAHLSGDRTLIDSFVNGEDVHTRTASEIFDVPANHITEDLRRQAKTINFGIMYGMGEYGLASRLKIKQEEARQFISAYFSRYPGVNQYIADTISTAYEKGYVTTMLNRRRYLPELKNDNRNIREFGERTAVNTPIQGTAADLIKVAMIRIADQLRTGKWKAKMILQIHDELLFEAPGEEMEALTGMVRKEMEGAIKLSVPVQVDIGIGDNWFEAH